MMGVDPVGRWGCSPSAPAPQAGWLTLLKRSTEARQVRGFCSRVAWREAFTWFVVAYRKAADLLKEGHLDAPFPEGCFPPGLPYVGDTG